MSFELIAILVVGVTLGVGQFTAIVISVAGFGKMDRRFEAMERGFEAMDRRFEAMDRRFAETLEKVNRGFDEITRMQRAVAGLVVQESEKIQALMRP